MSQANFNQLCNMLHSTMTKPHLLSLPYDVRRLIYEYYFPVNKHIHLTSGPISKKAIPEGSIESRLASEATSLMRVCKQVNLETTPILYATNTFFMVVNEKLESLPYWNSTRWLHNLRIPTRQMVKKLEILVQIPLERSLMIAFLSGVAHFPHLEMKFKEKTITVAKDNYEIWSQQFKEQSLKQRDQIISLCKGVMRARGSLQTTWNDGESFNSFLAYAHMGIIRDSMGLRGRKNGLEHEYHWIVDGDVWVRNCADLESISPWQRMSNALKLRV